MNLSTCYLSIQYSEIICFYLPSSIYTFLVGIQIYVPYDTKKVGEKQVAITPKIIAISTSNKNY